jgi:hypothetical protein
MIDRHLSLERHVELGIARLCVGGEGVVAVDGAVDGEGPRRVWRQGVDCGRRAVRRPASQPVRKFIRRVLPPGFR